MANTLIDDGRHENSGVRVYVGDQKTGQGTVSFAYKYLLMLRFLLINALGFAFVAAGWVEGYFAGMIQSEQAYLLAIIVGTFLLGLTIAAQKLWRISAELNELRATKFSPNSRAGTFLEAASSATAQGRANLIAALRLRMANRIGVVRSISNSLVILGLIGTVIGFIIALSGVDPDAVADVSAIGPMVSMLISGMSVALYTTLVGSVLNVWLNINYRILESGTVSFLTKIAEAGEYNAKS